MIILFYLFISNWLIPVLGEKSWDLFMKSGQIILTLVGIILLLSLIGVKANWGRMVGNGLETVITAVFRAIWNFIQWLFHLIPEIIGRTFYSVRNLCLNNGMANSASVLLATLATLAVLAILI